VASFGPFGSDHVHLSRSVPTFALVIWASGENPCESHVRRHVNHAPAGGLASVWSVTGVMVSSGFERGGGGGSAMPAGTSVPAAGGVHGKRIVCRASALVGRRASPSGRPFSARRNATSSA